MYGGWLASTPTPRFGQCRPSATFEPSPLGRPDGDPRRPSVPPRPALDLDDVQHVPPARQDVELDAAVPRIPRQDPVAAHEEPERRDELTHPPDDVVTEKAGLPGATRSGGSGHAGPQSTPRAILQGASTRDPRGPLSQLVFQNRTARPILGHSVGHSGPSTQARVRRSCRETSAPTSGYRRRRFVRSPCVSRWRRRRVEGGTSAAARREPAA